MTKKASSLWGMMEGMQPQEKIVIPIATFGITTPRSYATLLGRKHNRKYQVHIDKFTFTITRAY